MAESSEIDMFLMKMKEHKERAIQANNFYSKEFRLRRDFSYDTSKSPIKRCCHRLPSSYIVSYREYYRRLWDLIPIVLSIYNAILLPYELSYHNLSETYT